MGILDRVIWWEGDGMLMCILWRLSLMSIGSRYPFFGVYVVSVLCSDLVRMYLQPVTSEAFRVGYWVSEFICALASFGVTWEIYSHVLAPYKGVRRMARTVLSVLLTVLIIRTLAEASANAVHALVPSTVELERNLRVVQSLLLLGLVGLVVHYAVPLGRNMRSMLVGYGLYLGSTVVALSLRSQWGATFEGAEGLILRLGWNVALVIWCVGMWSYAPNPTPDNSLECDYERISQNTIRALAQLRASVTQSWRL